jgi:hypothetical protein
MNNHHWRCHPVSLASNGSSVWGSDASAHFTPKVTGSFKKTPLQASVLLDKTLEILSKYPLQESADSKVEDARGGLFTAELSPAIILSESFAGH